MSRPRGSAARAAAPSGRILAGSLVTFALLAAGAPALAQRPPLGGELDPGAGTLPAKVRDVGFDQRLGEPIPLDLAFRDETGAPVTLGDFFGRRPVILSLVYFDCPMLCPMAVNGLATSLRPLDFDAGREFEVVVVSFDPRETPELAAKSRRSATVRYAREGTDAGWHFLTGGEDSIRRLTDAVGFRYQFDEERGEFAHAAGIVVATPEGKVSRYFFGIEYPPKDLRLGLVESGEGGIGSPVDQILLYCFHYDPATGKYTAATMNLLRAAAVATVLALGTFIVVMRRREKLAHASSGIA